MNRHESKNQLKSSWFEFTIKAKFIAQSTVPTGPHGPNSIRRPFSKAHLRYLWRWTCSNSGSCNAKAFTAGGGLHLILSNRFLYYIYACAYLSIHPSVRPSVRPSVFRPSIHPSSIYLSIYLSISTTYLSIYISIYRSIYIYLSIYRSIYPSVYPHLHQHLYLVYISLSLSMHIYIYIFKRSFFLWFSYGFMLDCRQRYPATLLKNCWIILFFQYCVHQKSLLNAGGWRSYNIQLVTCEPPGVMMPQSGKQNPVNIWWFP